MLRSTAAPTYFPSYQGYADGALYANNPSFVAVSRAQEAVHGLYTRDCTVLSIGTGDYPYNCETSDPDGSHDWGLRQWAPVITDLLTSSSQLMVDWHCKALMKDRYHRISPALPAAYKLDDVHAIEALENLGRTADIKATLRFVDEHW